MVTLPHNGAYEFAERSPMACSYYQLPQVSQSAREVFLPSSKESTLTGCVPHSAQICFKLHNHFRESDVTATTAKALTRTCQLKEMATKLLPTKINQPPSFFHDHSMVTSSPGIFLQPWQPMKELRSAAVLKESPRNTWVFLRPPQGRTERHWHSSVIKLTSEPAQSVSTAGITKPSGLSVLLVFTSNKFPSKKQSRKVRVFLLHLDLTGARTFGTHVPTPGWSV